MPTPSGERSPRASTAGSSAYCWPREAVWVGDTLGAAGASGDRPERLPLAGDGPGPEPPFPYWFQKYTIDGGPEWETPAVDQTAIIPWGLERHYHRTGDLDFVAASWPMIEQAAAGLHAANRGTRACA